MVKFITRLSIVMTNADIIEVLFETNSQFDNVDSSTLEIKINNDVVYSMIIENNIEVVFNKLKEVYKKHIEKTYYLSDV